LENCDFSENNTNNSVIIRKKKGVSIDECARLCLNEASFDCEIMTYSSPLLECKWSSMKYEIFFDIDDQDIDVNYIGAIIEKYDSNLFISELKVKNVNIKYLKIL
jgi:hypothetical protein